MIFTFPGTLLITTFSSCHRTMQKSTKAGHPAPLWKGMACCMETDAINKVHSYGRATGKWERWIVSSLMTGLIKKLLMIASLDPFTDTWMQWPHYPVHNMICHRLPECVTSWVKCNHNSLSLQSSITSCSESNKYQSGDGCVLDDGPILRAVYTWITFSLCRSIPSLQPICIIILTSI